MQDAFSTDFLVNFHLLRTQVQLLSCIGNGLIVHCFTFLLRCNPAQEPTHEKYTHVTCVLFNGCHDKMINDAKVNQSLDVQDLFVYCHGLS
jgi:hypothetical protein